MACEFVAKRMFSGRGEDHEADTGTAHHAVCRSSEGCLTSSLCGVDANEIGAGWRVDDEERGVPYRGPFRFWISIVGVSAF
jgi:hypothetical protein